eukprot:jgi/Tetstr1/448580/TSEL_035829.t1
MEERKRLEEEITAYQLPNEPVQVYVRRYQNLWHLLNKAHGQWTFEYVATNYLIPGLRPDYDHIVDTTISAATVNEKLATIISAGQNMEARKRQRPQRVRACPPKPQFLQPQGPAARHQAQRRMQKGVLRGDPPPTLPLLSAGYRIYNQATWRETVTRDVIFGEITRPFSSIPALSMPVFQFPKDDHLLDEPQPSDQQEGTQAPPPIPPSAALASTQEGPPSPYQDEQHLPRHQEGDVTALPAPHFSGSAQLPSPYIDLSDYHPALVASAIAEVVRPYSAQMAALALPAPVVRVSKAPRNYKEAISSNHPDDWKQSMDREIASITKMETFVWISVPELRRDDPSAIITQTAWAFAEKHDKDGNLIKRTAKVVVRGDQLTAGENCDDTKTYAPVVSFIAWRTAIALEVQLDWELYQFDVTCAFLNAHLDEDVYVYPPPPPRRLQPQGPGLDQAWKLVKALYGLPQAPTAWFLRFSSFLRDFSFISSECDPGVWTLLAADGSLLAILCVYVDDITLATSPSSNIQERFQIYLFPTFDATTNNGLCTWLLGMAIDRKPGGVIHLHQEEYINDILTTFNMTECKPRRLPCTPDTDFHDPTVAYRAQVQKSVAMSTAEAWPCRCHV